MSVKLKKKNDLFAKHAKQQQTKQAKQMSQEPNFPDGLVFGAGFCILLCVLQAHIKDRVRARSRIKAKW